MAILGSPIDGGHDVLDEVLCHEAEYWRAQAQRSRPPLVDTDVDPEMLEQAVAPLRQLAAVAALLGASDSND
ncbi:hypothetical protein [Catellatospora tritici]|uniref:hypothetical protein n=1 Tax=Catellatospora tritici TaxID=2851566 RepID=UPI001C2D5616|nr:hypothetical protein [Catellatospora tritici]